MDWQVFPIKAVLKLLNDRFVLERVTVKWDDETYGKSDTEAIPAIGHDWDEGKVTKEPTYTENGEMTYTCKNDPTHTYTEVIPAKGYTYTDTVVAPTCTEQGYTLHECNEDASMSYKDSYTDALGHDYKEVTTPATCKDEGSVDNAYSSKTIYIEENHILYVPMVYQYTAKFPTKDTPQSVLDNLNISEVVNPDDDTFTYTSTISMDLWNDTFELPQDDTYMMPIEHISRILGWEFWTGDNVLKIVSDELDDTNPDNFVIDTTVREETCYDVGTGEEIACD